MSIKKPRVHAVVVTYNRKKLLEEFVNAVLKQSYPVDKLIIIDNNSTDGTEAFLKEKKFLDLPVIDYHKLEQNIGGAGGFSEGIKKAREYQPDWVWIMDDDTIPATDCLQELLSADAAIKGDVSFLASSVRGIHNEAMNVPKIKREQFNAYIDWYEYLDKGIVQIAKATFVSLLINIEAIKRCGLPWKPFFIWGDDSEYTQRLIRDYGPAYMAGKSVTIHKRFSSEALSLVKETNRERIPLYFYYYRNNLIGFWEYETIGYRFLCMGKLFYDFFCVLFQGKYKVKKIGVIIRAFFSFVFGTYDRNAFRKRAEI